jgi:carbon storage regulator
MLVITRKKNETIVVGGEIEVTVVEIRGDKVRLGIKTPGNVPVHRQEVYEAIKRPDPNPLWNDQTMGAVTEREPHSLQVLSKPATVPATLTISAAAVAQVDELRQSNELSRERAIEELLRIVAQADVASLCDLERRLS